MTNLDLFMKGELSLKTAEAAHVEIHNLRTQLAKANERIKELEEQLISACDALAKARDKVVTLERKNSFIKRSVNRKLRKEQENV